MEVKGNTAPLLPLLILLLLLPAPHAQKELGHQFAKWNYREGAGKVDLHGTYSITQTLEKWGNNIFYQCKEILMNRPQTLLPEYSGIRPLSEALDDLLKEVNALKKRLVELNNRLDAVGKALPPITYSAALSKGPGNYPRRHPAQENRSGGHLERRREKLTQPPHRPYPLKRRVYIRRKVKGVSKRKTSELQSSMPTEVTTVRELLPVTRTCTK